MQDSVLPADQVTRVACLLGRAVLRWQRDRVANPRSSELVSDSLPERLQTSPDSLLSVTGQNNRAKQPGKTTGQNNRAKQPGKTTGQNNRARPTLDTTRETQALCEEQRKKIATLIVEAIRRPSVNGEW
ncbi:hypothetical protein CA13_18450 [Planctomycetes bacterium CA13]|uniref:Uncharacterized protein n=1 Tax=Novipirellula herctigrandis TaxID=2527986 RepID=A0A5C5YZA0_9BACT|nr:hypothetical protein CA13_18450 [Planctomycetes bacterium CA13]